MSVTLHVCITCRAGQTLADGESRPGTRLHAAILEAGAPEGVNVVPVECLSACSQGCSVALSAPGRWSYVYGRLSEANAQRHRRRGRGLCRRARRHRALAQRAPRSSASNRSPAFHRSPCCRRPPNDLARKSPGHRRHRLSRLGQDHADPASARKSRRQEARRAGQRVRQRGRRRRDPEILRRCELPGGEYRRTRQWLHLLHRGRRFHSDHREAAGAAACGPITS